MNSAATLDASGAPAHEIHLTPSELRHRWKNQVSLSGLAKARMRGGADTPKYIRLFRKILYPITSLEEFERTHMRASTSDLGEVS